MGLWWEVIGLWWEVIGSDKVMGLWWEVMGLWWEVIGLWWEVIGLWWEVIGLWWEVIGSDKVMGALMYLMWVMLFARYKLESRLDLTPRCLAASPQLSSTHPRNWVVWGCCPWDTS